jgi:hypothetical protein
MGSTNCLNYPQLSPAAVPGSMHNMLSCAAASAYLPAPNRPRGHSKSGLNYLIESRFVELGSYGAFNRYSCRYPDRLANQSELIGRSSENRVKERRRALRQRLERQEQKLLSLTEAELDQEQGWRDRFMPREM